MANLKLKLVTPEREIVSEVSAEEVTAPGVLGEFGILPGHATYLTGLGEGVVSYRKNRGDSPQKTGTVPYKITGGFAYVQDDNVTILADSVLKSDSV